MAKHDSIVAGAIALQETDIEMNNHNHVSEQELQRTSHSASSTASVSTNSPTDSHEAPRDTHLPANRPKWLRSSASPGQAKPLVWMRNSRLRRIYGWLSGPNPSQRCTIQPLFPKTQSWLYRMIAEKIRGGSYTMVSLIFFVWLVAFSSILATSSLNTDQAIRLSCISRLWYKPPYCGLDGAGCQPFVGSPFTFACPSHCAKVEVLEPYTIGNEEIIYRNLVIGGGPIEDNATNSAYRGDSFICPAAIHAGLITNERGGCAKLTRIGEQRTFTASDSNGISSVAFPTSFPMSFTFSSVDISCGDPQWKAFAVSIVATILIALVTRRSGLFCSATFVIVFFQVGLASDSPYNSRFGGVLSIAFGRFLPAAFVGFVLYHFCLRRTLRGLEAHIEKTLFWLGPCWVGALNSYTLDRIPISRLTGHDLKQQPGAITALIIILLVILVAALGQVWYFRLEGRLLRKIGFYLILGIVIGCLVAIPGVHLRIHHYIIGLLLLPGTSLQTRPSLIYQGLLLGLFANGVARWGFASILETTEALRGEAQSGSFLPQALNPVIGSSAIQFSLPKLTAGFDGISILVNDVERFWQTNTSSETTFEWNRTQSDHSTFFRFAFTRALTMGGRYYGDYTKPGTWFANGSWSGIGPGAS